MVQLIALMYKDQHVGTLQKLLNIWFEASLSDSSDDNESNTYPYNQNSGDSSPMLTSDPTSDSSDNGINEKMTVEPSLPKQHVIRSAQNRHKVVLTSHKHGNHKLSDLDSCISSAESKASILVKNIGFNRQNKYNIEVEYSVYNMKSQLLM